jgi:hypothetical protein
MHRFPFYQKTVSRKRTIATVRFRFYQISIAKTYSTIDKPEFLLAHAREISRLLLNVVRRRGPTHTRALGGAATKSAHGPTPSFSLRFWLNMFLHKHRFQNTLGGCFFKRADARPSESQIDAGKRTPRIFDVYGFAREKRQSF